jgi:hypothetical protein
MSSGPVQEDDRQVQAHRIDSGAAELPEMPPCPACQVQDGRGSQRRRRLQEQANRGPGLLRIPVRIEGQILLSEPVSEPLVSEALLVSLQV